jgi:large subunit ribosomal protein L4e
LIKMKATIKSQSGENKGEKELPVQFHEEVRADLIKRAVQAIQSHRRQPYGTDPEAGKKYSSKISRRRRDYKTAYGIGISRVPRKILSYRGTRFNWQAATVPYAVGGRQAHPPKVEKVWSKKINQQERHKAIRSALAASVVKEYVLQRGHVVQDYPLVLEDSVESIKKTKDVLALLIKIGLEKELERSAKKTEKTGRARRRGRSAKKRKGPLFVVSKKCDLMKAVSNVPGAEIVEVESLNAELLAPGCDYGRLTLYTEGAIDKLDKLKLFTGHKIVSEKVEKTAKKELKQKQVKPKAKEIKK